MAESDQTSADGAPILDHIVAEVVHLLQNKRAVPVDPAEVRVLVEQEWARYEDARVRTFVPVLVRRAVIGDVLGGGRQVMDESDATISTNSASITIAQIVPPAQTPAE